jgi:prolyl-tRNA synthetase
MVLADNGEDSVVHCPQCGYGANLERADIGTHRAKPGAGSAQATLTKVDTPRVGSIEQVSKLLGCKPEQMLKTLIYMADEQPVAVLIRGDHDANEGKIRRALGAKKLELASPEVVERVTGAPLGFAGPVGLKAKLWADRDAAALQSAIVGANENDKHYKGAVRGRDYEVPETNIADLRNAADADPCPRCAGTVELRHAIEIGHVFKLGTKYSEALDARYLDDKEQLQPAIMGCYGIGVNRILAALIETTHDENGIIWPLSLAPYEVVLSPLNVNQAEVSELADKLYTELQAAGVDVLLDDRDQRPGVKFKDADLIGIPLRVVIGGRGLKEGQLEIKWRTETAASNIPLAGAAATIVEMLAERKKAEGAAKAEGGSRKAE